MAKRSESPSTGSPFSSRILRISTSSFCSCPADFPAIVRVRLANNDVVTGALQSVSPFFVTLTPQVGRPARFDLDQVLSIEFVMNGTARHRDQIARAWPAHVPLQVGTIGEADGAVGPAKDKTVRAIHRTLINLGLEMRWLDAYEMVEPALLTPERFPVLINLDQNERYFYTVKKPGDGLDAVVRYVQDGGTLLHLARGAPFSQGYIPESGRWKPVRPPRDLNAALQMDFVSPDRRSPRATSFQSPPNMGQRMTFVLDRRSPWATGLPDQVDIPMLADMRFRPITDDRVTSAAKFIPIYRLVDSTGMNYGVAMAVVDYGDRPRPHYGVYINHLLYEADYEGVPMLDILLPKVIEMAIGASPAVPIANMASSPAPPASRDAAQAPPAPPAAIPR
ncbi:MAG: hypothetical protein N3D11_15850 [Candidatus Sumerlaeia bacterium]|nr:hypothetical protein [Candidatus Sumerlaeia bacterium]